MIPPNLFGYTFIRNPSMVLLHTEIVKRSWKERFFSWPWEPWVKTKTIAYSIPDPHIYRRKNFESSQDQIIGHPATLAKIINSLPMSEANSLLNIYPNKFIL